MREKNAHYLSCGCLCEGLTVTLASTSGLHRVASSLWGEGRGGVGRGIGRQRQREGGEGVLLLRRLGVSRST